jgi:hypothetical protein
MNDWEIKVAVDQSNRSVAVVHPSAFQGRLQNLGPGEGREAAKIYPRDAANSNGFHTDNTPDGPVTIHNEMSQAPAVACSAILADCAALVDLIAMAVSLGSNHLRQENASEDLK